MGLKSVNTLYFSNFILMTNIEEFPGQVDSSIYENLTDLKPAVLVTAIF